MSYDQLSCGQLTVINCAISTVLYVLINQPSGKWLTDFRFVPRSDTSYSSKMLTKNEELHVLFRCRRRQNGTIKKKKKWFDWTFSPTLPYFFRTKDCTESKLCHARSLLGTSNGTLSTKTCLMGRTRLNSSGTDGLG